MTSARAPAMNINSTVAVLHVSLVRLNSTQVEQYPLRTHSSIVSAGIQAQEIDEAVNGIMGRSLETIINLVKL